MILVAEYRPKLDAEPKIFRAVSKATMWRVELSVEHLDGSIDRRTIRVPDKMKIGEVHPIAISELADMTKNSDQFLDGGFSLWAEA